MLEEGGKQTNKPGPELLSVLPYKLVILRDLKINLEYTILSVIVFTKWIQNYKK